MATGQSAPCDCPLPYRCPGGTVTNAIRAVTRPSHSIVVFTAVRLNSDRRPQDIVSAPIIGLVVGNDLKAK